MKPFYPLFFLFFCCIHHVNSQTLDFTDMAQTYGIYYSYSDGADFGLGGSLYDFNSDGYDDISFGGIASEPGHFYVNNGDGSGFTPYAPPGVDLVGSISKCLLWVDYDNDGIARLSSNNLGTPISLYKNAGGTYLDNNRESIWYGHHHLVSCWRKYAKIIILTEFWTTTLEIATPIP